MASSLQQQMGRLALTASSEPMHRPVKGGYGSKGTPIKVLVNTFKVTPPSATIYHLDVKISPEGKRPARLNREIWRHLVQSQKPFGTIAVAYDGNAMAYSAKKLPADEGQWTINLPESDGSISAKGNTFTIKITLIRPIHLDGLRAFVQGKPTTEDPSLIQSAVQALNVAIQHGPMMTHPNRGASFFLRHDNPANAVISKGIEMWRGYYTSLRPGPGGLFINVDLSSQPMIMAGSLPEVMMAYVKAKSRGPGPVNLAVIPGPVKVELNRFLRNLKITVKLKDKDGREQHRKIKEISWSAAEKSTFDLDGGKTNVAAYTKTHYGVTLRHPDWPCVRVSKVALFPIEVVDLQGGQKYARKLDPTQTAESLKLTTIAPANRVPLLRQGIDSIRPTTTGSPLNQWGLEISKDLMKVDARILQAPQVQYKAPRPLQPNSGTWDLRGVQFIKSCPPLVTWFVVVFGPDRGFHGMSRDEVQQSVDGFVAGLSKTGISVKNPRPAIIYAPSHMPAERVAEFLRVEAPKAGVTSKPQLILCYFSAKPCDEYTAIKRFGDLDHGIATQGLAIAKAKRGSPQYYANVALKVNVKLNGVNSTVDLGPAVKGAATMIFGADVSHPAPGSFAPSIAALVGTVSTDFARYGSSIKLQGSREEMIQDLGDMLVDLLKQHFATTKVQPQRLIFFRDGVSEGQFSQVMAAEVGAIRVACQRLSPTYKPSLTYIVCGKRHKISLFPVDPREGDKTGNVKAGTTVDTEITSAFNFDWYTQSHASLLGTSRSAHYTVLVDDSKFSADVLQQLVYNLCYTYARCTRSVSYATPAYYADRLCTRAALYLNAEADDAASAISTHSGASADEQRRVKMTEYRQKLKDVHSAHASALFYM